MSVVISSRMDNDKLVGPIAPPSLPELNKYDILVSGKEEKQEEDQPDQADIWNLIQSQNPKARDLPPPYVHPLVRHSLSSLSQRSLEICTESLGSETGSDDFLPSYTDSESDTESDDGHHTKIEEFDLFRTKDTPPVEIEVVPVKNQEVGYHCTTTVASRRKSPLRSFPPPLPSISRHSSGPCLRMRPHRLGDGRLVMEAVPVPSQNYLQARRHDGRLLLSFTDQHSAAEDEESEREIESDDSEVEEIETEESEEEEEVEVVDRGTMVEIKVSTQPNLQMGGSVAALKRVHRSSLVINKFVGSSPDDAMTAATDTVPAILPPSRRAGAMPTTAAAAVAAASALSASSQYEELQEEKEEDGKLLFVATTASARRRSKEELLHQMRRCSQLRRPLFIWEPRCIAT